MSEMKCSECGTRLFKTPRGNLVCEKCSYHSYVKVGNSSEPLESKKKSEMGMAVLAVVLFAIIGWLFSIFINVSSGNLDQKGSQTVAELAEQGDAKAQNNLGVMYDKGEGVPQASQEQFLYI